MNWSLQVLVEQSKYYIVKYCIVVTRGVSVCVWVGGGGGGKGGGIELRVVISLYYIYPSINPSYSST